MYLSKLSLVWAIYLKIYTPYNANKKVNLQFAYYFFNIFLLRGH